MKHQHAFIEYRLKYNRRYGMLAGRVYYTGYRCACGEIGYAIR